MVRCAVMQEVDLKTVPDGSVVYLETLDELNQIPSKEYKAAIKRGIGFVPLQVMHDAITRADNKIEQLEKRLPELRGNN